MRSGLFDNAILYIKMAMMDDHIINNSPAVDQYLLKYDKSPINN